MPPYQTALLQSSWTILTMKKKLPNMKSLCKDPNYEGLPKGMIKSFIISGVAFYCVSVTSEDSTNDWVKLRNSTRHQENREFYCYEVPLGVKNMKFKSEVT